MVEPAMAVVCTYCGGHAVVPGMNEEDWGALCPHCDGSGMEPNEGEE